MDRAVVLLVLVIVLAGIFTVVLPCPEPEFAYVHVMDCRLTESGKGVLAVNEWQPAMEALEVHPVLRMQIECGRSYHCVIVKRWPLGKRVIVAAELIPR